MCNTDLTSRGSRNQRCSLVTGLHEEERTMAASLLVKSRAVLGLSVPAHSCFLNSVRFASKKSGGSSKNLGGKSPGKRYGIKKQDGNFVHAGNILATQRLLRYHPGAHVGKGTNNTLFALEDGYVKYTKEVYIPPPRSPEATQVITKLPKGSVLYKTFVNVLPAKQQGKFRLVDMV